MRILALDQASKTGWSLFEDSTLMDYGILDCSGIRDNVKRHSELKKKINKLIKKTKAEVIVIEDTQQQFNINTFKVLTELLGVLKNTFHEQDLAFIVSKSSEWRRVCGIKGKKRKEQKENAQLWVRLKFGVRVSEDEADAICIGWYGVKKMKVG